MKTFPSYDYTLCDNKDCPKKDSCMRCLTYRKAMDENFYRITIFLINNPSPKCEHFVKAE